MILQNQIDKYLQKNSVNGCVYKLTYGGRYIIVKGKTLTGSLFLIQKGYGWFSETTAKPDTLYLHFYNFIKDNPEKKFTVRVLLKSKNGYSLLKKEQLELDKAQYDIKCLNNNVESYVPRLDAAGENYGWLPKQAVLNFNRYLKSKQRTALRKQYKKKQQIMLAKSA